MTSSSKSRSDLFAAKGRAIPACSKPMIGRPAKAAAPAADPKPARTEVKAQDDGPASVLSIDLRRALVPARSDSSGAMSSGSISPSAAAPEVSAPARVEPRPASSAPRSIAPAPQPQNQGMAGPFIGALVAVSIAAGIFYIVERDQFGATPEADALGAPTAETANPEAPTQAKADGLSQEAEAGDSATGAAPADGGLPSFDLVRVEPDGSAVIAGRAAPYADLILLHNGEPIGKVKADWAGEWAFVTDEPLPADRHQITILVNDPDAQITLPEGAAPPAQVSGTGDARPR